MKLTPRERDVLRLLAAKLSNKEIGSALSITEGTVKVHLLHILAKLGVDSRAAAVSNARARKSFALSL